jgi:hypothetical protein
VLLVKKSLSRRSEAEIAVMLWEGGRVTHSKEDRVVTYAAYNP